MQNLTDLSIKVITLRKLERDINKNMKDFGSDHMITLSDITRKIAKEDPELLKQIDDLIDKMESKNE